jgi:hypothetical protein
MRIQVRIGMSNNSVGEIVVDIGTTLLMFGQIDKKSIVTVNTQH